MKLMDPFAIPFSGINLIEASAGTGKTYNIASLFVRAIAELDIDIGRILVVTYTEAATKELRDRLMRRLRDSLKSLEGQEFDEDEFLKRLPGEVSDAKKAGERIAKAIHSFDEAAIYTIHGFCYQALQEQAFESRALFDMELIGDDREVTGEAVDDYWRNWVSRVSADDNLKPLHNLLVERGYTPEKLVADLYSYVGKPYLKLLPEEFELEEGLEETTGRLGELYSQLQKEWNENRQEIKGLLLSDRLSGNKYRSDWVESWMSQMDDQLAGNVPPVTLFDKFSRFSQSYVDASVKKSSSDGPPQHLFFSMAEAYLQLAGELSFFAELFKKRLLIHLRQQLPSRKEELQVLSYDDLLIHFRDALQGEKGKRLAKIMRQSYPVALVDEFQDTDPVQYQIFRDIYRPGGDDVSLFMIGDPKQSIYSFRGADIFAYLEAKKDVPETNAFSLERNFRSVPELIESVNTVFRRAENPFILRQIEFRPARPGKEAYDRLTVQGEQPSPVEFRRLHGPGDELPLGKGAAQEWAARDTALRIKELLAKADRGDALIGDQKVQAKDIAVLVRSHRQAALIGDALAEEGMKSVQYSQDSVFDSTEAEELYYLLQAVAEAGGNEGKVRAALATPVMGYTARELLALEEDEEKWVEKLESFSRWHSLWQEKGFAYMFRSLMKEEGIPERLVTLKNGERKLTNLIHLSELVSREERSGRSGSRSILQWIARKRKEEKKEQEAEQLRLESDEDLLKVVTMHRSKGLEYPIVFCPFLWHSPRSLYTEDGNPLVYHDDDDPSTVYLDLWGKNDPGRPAKRYKAAREELAESIRLAYVAMTRARHQCVISWTYANKTACSALGYLLMGADPASNVLEAAVTPGLKHKEDPYPEALSRSVSGLVEEHPELFGESGYEPDTQRELVLQPGDLPELHARTSGRDGLEPGYSISSFSSLIRNTQDEYAPGLEAYFDEPGREQDAEGEEEGEPLMTPFTFPKGPNPGTAMHHIFEDEELIFSEADDATIRKVTKKHLRNAGIDEKWLGIASDMVSRALNKKLRAGGNEAVCLAEIPRGRYLPEMEFYFTSPDIRLSELLGLLRPGGSSLELFDGYAEEGYLKGFIDLTFEHGGRYYLLDYKTNYLGDRLSDYDPDMLKGEMEESLYDVQYHLYTLALHRFLRSRKPGYSYEDHFGGVFYLFLRGLNADGDEGVFYDRPEAGLVSGLEELLGRGGNL